MQIAYYSLSGNISRMLQESGLSLANCIDVKKLGSAEKIESDFILITSTYTDRVPAPVLRFLGEIEKAGKLSLMRGVIGSGNRNFGPDFCAAAHHIASDYSLPVLLEVEVWGTKEERDMLRSLLQQQEGDLALAIPDYTSGIVINSTI